MHKKIIAALTLALIGSPVLAEEAEGPNITPKAETDSAETTSSGIEPLMLARQLAELGLAEQDPLALIVAARLMRQNPAQDLEAEKTEGERTSEPDPLDSVDHLLDQAREFSGGRAEILALIETVPEATKGAVGYARRVTDSVRPRRTDIWTIPFRGGERAEVGVIGAGPGDTIDCFVYDENGGLIGQDISINPTCSIAWRPIWTGNFRIHVQNLTSRSIPYLLLTN